MTITEKVTARFTLDSASCVDTSGGTPGTVGILIGTTLTIAATDLQPTTTLVCTFRNTQAAQDLAITNRASPGVVASGGTVTFTLTASNIGAVDVTNAALSAPPRYRPELHHGRQLHRRGWGCVPGERARCFAVGWWGHDSIAAGQR